MISNYYAARSQVTTYLLERVKNLRLVRSSNMEENETREGEYQFRNLFRTCIRYTLSDSLMTSFMGLTPIGLIIITFIIGGIKIASGELTPGVVIGFFGVSGMASVRISVLITVYGNYAETSGVVQKISTVLNAEEESNEGRPMDLPDADIAFENVQFAYGDKPVLKGVSCVIPKKRITAIIGNNGAGKSTIFKLLEKMYEPSSGRILFGDVPLTTFDPVAWRKAFALVSQDRPLLSGTIRENMTYGCNRSVSDEELRGAAKQANILELIESLPDGFDTHVEPGGSNFSGGQRQCIAIARAIMRNPDYLLLDEATSNMDAQSERLVSEALANLMRGRTTIMIAHNLSAISCADYIIVLQDGKVDACGTPEEAAKASVIFRDFVKSQTATALC
jgi:ATP-binding cassette subfamily B protein AbcA/BmrA